MEWRKVWLRGNSSKHTLLTTDIHWSQNLCFETPTLGSASSSSTFGLEKFALFTFEKISYLAVHCTMKYHVHHSSLIQGLALKFSVKAPILGEEPLKRHSVGSRSSKNAPTACTKIPRCVLKVPFLLLSYLL